MAETLYPYKIRVQFTRRQEAGLKAAAARYETGITDAVRRYVAEGLARDGITGEPPAPMPEQTTIDTPGDPDDDQ